MLLAILTFGAIVLLVLGSYWAFVLRPEQAAQTAVGRRLRAGSRKLGAVLSVSSEGKRLSEIPALDAALSRTKNLSGTAQGLIDRSGLRLTVGALFLGAACLAGISAEVTFLLRGGLVLGLLVGAAVGAAPFLFVRYKANKRTERFEELFPEALGLIVRALRAGHAFTTGLAMAAEEMEDPVGPEFKRLYDQQNFGMPLEDALRDLAERVPLIDVKFFVTAVLTQRQAGGNLAEVLENLISVVRDRFKVKRQIRVVTAHARITGTVLMVLPVVTAVLMLLMAPAHMRVLWTDPAGIRMLYAGIILQVLGVIAIRRIVRVDY
jgi:tight adherence protein B